MRFCAVKTKGLLRGAGVVLMVRWRSPFAAYCQRGKRMIPIKKMYCRGFQAAFWLALPLLPYREPKRIEGIGGVPQALASCGIRRVLLVTDKGIRALGLTKPLEGLLEKAGIACHIYEDTVANPTVANVEDAKNLYLRSGCQGIIAFGGGSAMDCAKATGARLARPNKPLGKMEGLLKVHKTIPPLIAVPTTAGTGSETTLAAVITDGKTHHKYPINDFSLIPRYAVLEPSVTLGLPPALTATTGMDALTHATEAYIGRSTTKETRTAAVWAVRLILDNLETAYLDGQNHKARAAMLRAAYLAGLAFTKSYVGYVHAVAHSLGGQYGTPHGLANAVLLPHVLRAYGKAAVPRLARLAKEARLAAPGTSAGQAAEVLIHRIEQMNRDMQIPATIAELRREDIPKLARQADKEANPLYPVPVLWNAKELEEIYRMVLPGSA